MRQLLIAGVVLASLSLSACLPPVDFSDARRVDGPTPQASESEEQAPTTPSPTPSPSSPSAEAEARLPSAFTLSGQGETSTPPFELDGDYSIDWTTGGDCFYSADLESTGDEPVYETLFSADAATSGQSFVYGVSGEFYAEVITGPAPSCPWEMTIAPLR